MQESPGCLQLLYGACPCLQLLSRLPFTQVATDAEREVNTPTVAQELNPATPAACEPPAGPRHAPVSHSAAPCCHIARSPVLSGCPRSVIRLRWPPTRGPHAPLALPMPRGTHPGDPRCLLQLSQRPSHRMPPRHPRARPPPAPRPAAPPLATAGALPARAPWPSGERVTGTHGGTIDAQISRAPLPPSLTPKPRHTFPICHLDAGPRTISGVKTFFLAIIGWARPDLIHTTTASLLSEPPTPRYGPPLPSFPATHHVKCDAHDACCIVASQRADELT